MDREFVSRQARDAQSRAVLIASGNQPAFDVVYAGQQIVYSRVGRGTRKGQAPTRLNDRPKRSVPLHPS